MIGTRERLTIQKERGGFFFLSFFLSFNSSRTSKTARQREAGPDLVGEKATYTTIGGLECGGGGGKGKMQQTEGGRVGKGTG